MIPERISDYEVSYLNPHKWNWYDHLTTIDEALAHFKQKYGREPARIIEQYRMDGRLRYIYLGPVESVTCQGE